MRYTRIADERQLIEGLTEPGARILCGGTDLLVRMRSGLETPQHLLDISDLETLKGIRESDGSISIGAATLETDLFNAPPIRDRLPLLAAALAVLGSLQIRNRGTLGGNLVNASPAADSAIPLLAYDAELELVCATGERALALSDFFLGPGKTALAQGEFVRSIRIPVPNPKHLAFYHKVGKRRALTIAIASIGIAASIDQGRISDIRIAAGSVAPTPVRLRSVEQALIERSLDNKTIEEAGQLATRAVSPIDDIRATAEYRRHAVGDLLVRGLRSFLTG